ncbi:sugar ABC transporter substrate-binding protein [Streptomyces sp. TRM66268-LWL]|uniref:Sugar ABC transporter substrate-binding protein n=1 Tax=Streptomyces polyasparticus TaxID=2767826 RepID=A0ABR7SCD2_9ACTN|nr:sugar ABC transporter substrate-binding protein [Streptomyces polyasparticus]MBC9712637.1 sugar ABC transporter substrate-binding protein [Streptomyces polyasparticus]
MRKQTRISLTALAAASVLALTACGGGSGTASDGPVNLRMTVWSGSPEHMKLLNGIADEYRKAHPDVKSIKFDVLPLENYTTTLTTQIAGGKSPDLAWIFENSAADFVSSGALAEVNLKDEKDVLPSAKKIWEQDGKLYAYPFSTSPFGVFVNTDMLKEAGQPTPAELIAQGKWNWDKVSELGAAVHDKTGKTGMVIRDFDYKMWDNLAQYWGGWGAEAWSEDGKTCGFDKPEMVAAMTSLHKAVFEDESMLAPGTSADFFAGESAMTVTQMSRASLLGDKFKWDFVPLPEGPKGEYDVIGQAGIARLAKSAHPEEADGFLEFLTNKDNSAKLGAYFPQARSSQLDAATLAKSNPKLSEKQLSDVVIDGIQKGKVKPVHSGQAEINDAVRGALDPLWKKDADVAKVLQGVCTAINPLLEQ